MGIIDSNFDDMIAKCFPDGVSDRQRSSMRQIFFAGASVVAGVLDSATEEAVPEEVGVAILADMHREILEFARALHGTPTIN